MRENFKASLAAVLANEGGNDDDPDDNGGRTSRGITQRVYTAWLKEKGRANKDVWKATQADVEAIYLENYWLPHGDTFPIGIDYLYFDMAVNAGPYRAAKLLQRTLGLTEDGRIGPITRQAVASTKPETLIDAYSETKRKFYRSLHQPKFLRGWLNRTNDVQKIAKRMVK